MHRNVWTGLLPWPNHGDNRYQHTNGSRAHVCTWCSLSSWQQALMKRCKYGMVFADKDVPEVA
jgi:hypothetical protein